MKSISALFAIVAVLSSAFAAEASGNTALEKTLKDLSGIEGKYSPVGPASDACAGGEAKIIKSGGAVSLQVTSRYLFPELNLSHQKETNSGCQFEYHRSVDSKGEGTKKSIKLAERTVSVCKDLKSETRSTLSYERDRIIYVSEEVSTIDNKSEKSQTKCEWRRAR